jgi:cell division septum initiation protein DivIVA
MAWPEGSSEAPGFHAERDLDGGEEESSSPPASELLDEVNAVAQHLRELQKRLGGYHAREESSQPPAGPAIGGESPGNGLGRQAEDASEHVASIIAAAEAAAAEIRMRAEATASEILANAESAAARIREEARSDERRLFEAIDALRPATAEFQHALERVHDAAVAVLMSYPRS